MSRLSPETALTVLTDLLAEETGQEISASRMWRIETALRPLLREHGFPSVTELAEQIVKAKEPALITSAVDAMLNHETSFFRDIGVFQEVERTILPKLREQAVGKTLRIWSAGCSTGMEPYSIAMMLKRMGSIWDGWKISIVATDVSPLSVERARQGRFAQMEVQRGLSVDDLLRWFEPEGDAWRISANIREMVHFQADNVLASRHATGSFDLILCRNVMLYFPENARIKACENLARHARPGCFLILGAGETLVGRDSVFTLNPATRCTYRMPLATALQRAG